MKKVNESEFVAIIKAAKLDFRSDCFYYDDEENINHCVAFNELSAEGMNVGAVPVTCWCMIYN